MSIAKPTTDRSDDSRILSTIYGLARHIGQATNAADKLRTFDAIEVIKETSGAINRLAANLSTEFQERQPKLYHTLRTRNFIFLWSRLANRLEAVAEGTQDANELPVQDIPLRSSR